MILKGIGGFYYVKTKEGVFECKARGIFRKEGLTPLPGDMVTISAVDEKDKTGWIEEINKRESQLVRPAVANVNQIIIVIAACAPVPDLLLLDKLLITAEKLNLKVRLCINKIDMDENLEYRKTEAAYVKSGYSVLLTSSKTGTGFEKLRALLPGNITVFAGQSGVGKSTILNTILHSWVMQTGELSRKAERGKHTTRHAELLELSFGGFVADTPGFSSYELDDIEAEELELYYPEMRDKYGKCRFTHCSHISEPECRVKEAVEKGFIDEGRYDRFILLYNSLKQNKTYKSKKEGKT
jgi:ribosome biogenesis GTPase